MPKIERTALGILAGAFLVLAVATVYNKIIKFGISPEERMTFLFRTAYCILIDIYILVQCVWRKKRVRYKTMNHKDKILTKFATILMLVMYIGLFWMFSYETLLVGESNMGSVPLILSIMVLFEVNNRYRKSVEPGKRVKPTK